jgi:hypothetical protein
MTPDEDYAKLRVAFTKGIVIALAVMVLIGVGIHFANAGHHRPEGAAERWLNAISDLTRKGVKKDAEKRATETGSVALGRTLLPKVDTGGKGGFPDLEVGKAHVVGDTARVPYHLHQWADSGAGAVRRGTIVLQRQPDDRWKVTNLAPRRAGERVPSEGGAPPSSASLGVWVGGALFGLALTVAMSLLIQWASRSSRPVAATAP